MKHKDKVIVGINFAVKNRSDLKNFDKMGMGNLAVLNLGNIKSKNEMMKLIQGCIKNKTYFFCALPKDPDLQNTIKKYAGSFFLGRQIMPEFGSLVYWPRDFFDFLYSEYIPGKPRGMVDEKIKYKERLFNAPDMKEAKEKFLEIVREKVSEERRVCGDSPIFSVESSVLHKYLFEAGLDFGSVEIFPGEPILMVSSLRGATRGYSRKFWKAYMAKWYAGLKEPLRSKRYAVGLYFSYLSGAGIIFDNAGVFKEQGIDYKDINCLKEMRCSKRYAPYRQAIRKFYGFVKKDDRPEIGPLTKIGIVHGHLDGWSGMWDAHVWGQNHSKEWEWGEPERGWEFFYNFFRRDEWSTPYLAEDKNYTGNPPSGQIDVVPLESPLENLLNYSCLLFLGWNTITKEHYQKLKNYVEKGGHLIMSIAHLSTHLKRNGGFKLINNGDFRDLFGIEVTGNAGVTTGGVMFINNSSLATYKFPVFYELNWCNDPACMSGDIPLSRGKVGSARIIAAAARGMYANKQFPILTENKVGKGYAYLLTPWCYPGHSALKGLMNVLIQVIIAGEQGKIKFIGSDKIRWAVYQNKGKSNYVVYLLNTDLDLRTYGELYFKNRSIPVSILPGDIKVIRL